MSGIFVGNAGVVAFNWNTVIEQTNFNIDTIGDSNFIFQDSKHYTLWTSFIYSTYMKKEYYNDDASRSVAGIDLEMIVHYILYAFNNEHGKNGAKIQRFDPSPLGIKKDFDAFVFEFISILINPIFYFFR